MTEKIYNTLALTAIKISNAVMEIENNETNLRFPNEFAKIIIAGCLDASEYKYSTHFAILAFLFCVVSKKIDTELSSNMFVLDEEIAK